MRRGKPGVIDEGACKDEFLSEEDKRFAALLLARGNLTSAFVEAYGDCGASGEKLAKLAALRAAELRILSSVARKITPDVGDEYEAGLRRIWSREMALDGLKKIFQASLQGAKVEICDENGDIIEVKFNPSAANAATKAVETANRMLGYSTPPDDGEDNESTLVIEFGEAEEFSE